MIDDMDMKTLTNIVNDYLEEDLDKISDEELLKEVEEFYPHLIEE